MFGRRRKLNFIYREKRIVWVASSRKWSLSPPLAQANRAGEDYSSSISIFSSLRCVWVSDCFWRPGCVLLLRLRPVWRVERVEARFVGDFLAIDSLLWVVS